MEREVRALLKASKDLACRNLILLTESEEREEKASWFGISGTIKIVPLWKYFEQSR